MYRSDEIIQLFSNKHLPKDVIQYILKIERYLTCKYNIKQWIRFSKIFHNHQKIKLFYEDIKYSLLNEIQEINGNFVSLKRYKSKIYKIKYDNKMYSLYLNSLRY
jgi:hypothetical protein